MTRPPDHSPRRRGRPPNTDGAQTRDRLLNAALELFARNGYAATSVREIADAVGLRDSAIYAHFSSKEEIYDSLVSEYGPGLLHQLDLDGARLAQLPPHEALPRFVGELADVWDEPDVRRATAMLIRQGLAGIEPALAEVQGQLRHAFGIWLEQGFLRQDTEVDLLVWEFVSPLAATRLLMLAGDAPPDARQQARQLMRQHADYFVRTAARRPT